MARIVTSCIDKSAVLWSIKKRSITIIEDDTFDQIKEDFTAIRGEIRLPICSRSFVQQIFQAKDNIEAIEALKKHSSGFQAQVLVIIISKVVRLLCNNYLWFCTT